MAITGEDLIAPKGEIELSMFPGNSQSQVASRLQTYVNEGYEKTSIDNAVSCWAYYRAYLAVYLIMSSQPIHAELKDQSYAAFDREQAGRFYDLAMAKYEEFNAILNESPPPPNVQDSSSLHTRFRW